MPEESGFVKEKRIMLLGAGGQIGQALQHEKLPEDWRFGLYGRAEIDITHHHAMQSAIQKFNPAIIINAAAMTNVDKAENDHQQAIDVNFEAMANLAAQCSAMDIPLIHLSTDYVFDGRDGALPYKTDDKMNPLNMYGESKMMGEEALRHELAWHVILRVSSVFSAYGKNILTNTLKMIDERDELKIVTDQRACPTYAPDIAKAIIAMAQQILKGKSNGFGVFHLCGMPEATRFEFVQAVMEAYAPHTTRHPNIIPAKSSDFAGFAERPAYSVLDCAKIREVYGIEQHPWQEGLAEAMAMLMQDKKRHD